MPRARPSALPTERHLGSPARLGFWVRSCQMRDVAALVSRTTKLVSRLSRRYVASRNGRPATPQLLPAVILQAELVRAEDRERQTWATSNPLVHPIWGPRAVMPERPPWAAE